MEFEKWYEKEIGPINFPGIQEFYKARKKTWKAALKWVLSKIDESNSDGSIIDYIKKELGDSK